MADWTDQNVNSLLPGEPWDSAKALAAFENPVAISEGSANAPRLYLRALERLEAGDQIRSRLDEAVFLPDGSLGTRHSFAFAQYGTIRASITKISGSGFVRILRVRNGAEVALASSTVSGTTQVITADVAVLPGDLVILQAEAGTGGMNISNARFSTNGQDLWPGVSTRLEGNRNAT